jgi:pyruvate/2-oxoglutarate dehydrogenase complex dihydrolipoamide acyltransferase (E2) component
MHLPMRSIFKLLTAAVLALTLAACGAEEDDTAAEGNNAASNNAATNNADNNAGNNAASNNAASNNAASNNAASNNAASNNADNNAAANNADNNAGNNAGNNAATNNAATNNAGNNAASNNAGNNAATNNAGNNAAQGGGMCASGEQGPNLGQIAPDITLMDCDGNPHSLHELCAYEVGWIFEFAAWCPPCRRASSLRSRGSTSALRRRGLGAWVVISEAGDFSAPDAELCREVRDQKRPEHDGAV